MIYIDKIKTILQALEVAFAAATALAKYRQNQTQMLCCTENLTSDNSFRFVFCLYRCSGVTISAI
jgi:hypothetical protein